MDKITVHTGFPGDSLRIEIEWYDHNNIKLIDVLDIEILEQDKPRTLEICINGCPVYKNQSGKPITFWS